MIKAVFTRLVIRGFCLAALGSVSSLSAQDPASEPVFPSSSDSSQTRVDTLAVPKRSRSDVDAPIDYSARHIENHIAERITILTGNAVVKYKSATLEADKITVDWNRSLLIAEGLSDSLGGNDGANGVPDTLARNSGVPVFTDQGDRLTGEKMEYNFKSERGRVLRGRTEFDGGKYFGEHIKRVGDNVLNVAHGIYTTCDLEPNPHFHFESRRMKIMVQDKVIAKPIVFYIGKIPLAILPFAVFPTKTGRHSGLVIPRYGQSVTEGRYLRGLGYYWAINDYLDATATVDIFDRAGWLLDGRLNYSKRYSYRGSISGSFSRKNFVINDQQERVWDLDIYHNQPLGQNSSFTANGRFVSNDRLYRSFSDNRNEQLTRRLVSNASYSTSFGASRNNSLTINLSDQKDLENGTFQRTLPQMSLTFGQRQLFGAGEKDHKKIGKPTEDDRPWYHNFYYNLSSRADYSMSGGDTVETETIGRANHDLSLSLNSPKKYFGWLTLNQSVAFNEDWFDRTKDYFVAAPETSSTGSITFPVESQEQKGFAARHTFSYRASASTNLYGTFQPNIGPVRALRHKVSPSLSFNYQPDFSDPDWGYFQEVIRPDGSKVRQDRFGGTPSSKLQSVSASVGNFFQMKAGPEDSLRKIDLFNLDFSSGYNFAAKQYKYQSLSSSFRASPAHGISISMNTTHTFYDYDLVSGNQINRLLWKKKGLLGGRYLRLTNFSAHASLPLQGGKGGPHGSQLGAGETAQPFDSELDEQLDLTDRFSPESNIATAGVPWSANLALSFSLNRANPYQSSKSAQLSLNNGQIQLTDKWRVGFSGQFDFVEKAVVYQRYEIYRDLHCWKMLFTWTPSGPHKSFYFSISIKAPHLKDIKIERQGGRESIFGGSYY